MEIQVKEGGTSLSKTFRKYNLVFKGLIQPNQLSSHNSLFPQRTIGFYLAGPPSWTPPALSGTGGDTPLPNRHLGNPGSHRHAGTNNRGGTHICPHSKRSRPTPPWGATTTHLLMQASSLHPQSPPGSSYKVPEHTHQARGLFPGRICMLFLSRCPGPGRSLRIESY